MDPRVFDAVPTQLFAEDRRSILTVQGLIAARSGEYAYLEIGSYLGGSLQPHLVDERCSTIFSIDRRPARQPDERGMDFEYPDNTTERMLRTLEPHYGGHLGKLRTFETDASEVDRSAIRPRARLCLIDGEHTDRAVLSDFSFCLEVSDRPAMILFDDAHIVYRGFARSVELAKERGEQVRAYVLPRKIAAIEIGDLGLYRDPALADLIASAEPFIYATSTLDPYRRRLLALLDLPVVRTLRRVRARLLTRGRPSGGSREDRPT